MSIIQTIIEASKEISKMSPREQRKNAHVAGKLYESFFFAALKDIEKAGKWLESNEAPALKIGKLIYTTVLPFSATLMENVEELIHEAKNEFDNQEPEPVLEDEANEVSGSKAVSMANIAAGTVRRGSAHLKPLPFEFRRHDK